MKKLWKKKSCGAVTVFVTLLLIPSVLITGTGVDIARVYAARSMLQDANQLAINSLMVEYDAQLQDLYGLFAVTEEDEELRKLVNEYVEKVIFAPDAGDTTADGTLGAFYGSEVESTVTSETGQNLNNADKLRRQIEEYAKLRAPVIVAQEIIDRLDDFKQVNEDSKVIKKKLAIEKKVEEIDKYYKKIYENIKALNKYNGQEVTALTDLNVHIAGTKELFDEMLPVRKEYEANSTNKDRAEILEDKYEGYRDMIVAWVNGGWTHGDWNEEKNKWEGSVYLAGYKRFADQGASTLEDFLGNPHPLVRTTNTTLEDLLDWCKKADEAKRELKTQIDNLKRELPNSGCHQELKDGLLGTEDEAGILEEYEKLVKFNLTGLAQQMYDRDAAHINALVDRLKNIDKEPVYISVKPDKYEEFMGLNTIEDRINMVLADGKITEEEYYGEDILEGYTMVTLVQTTKDMDINTGLINKQRKENGQEIIADPLFCFGDDGFSTPIPFGPPDDDKFYTWLQCDEAFKSTAYKEFWDELENIYGDGAATKDEKKAGEASKSDVYALLSTVQDMISDVIPDPAGAIYYKTKEDASSGSNTFGKGGDWGDEDKAQDNMSDALNNDLISKLENLTDSIANKALILVYASEMFSSYTTEDGEKNMAGTAMGVKNNYFFQSELEYIYEGNKNNAMTNHNAVGGMIVLLRFVMNYVACFSIPFVNNVVNSIRSALAWTGPLALAVAELGRMALALAESLVDLSLLRSGHKVALLKNKDNWKISPDTIGKVSKSMIENAGKDDNKDDDALDDTAGFIYADYLRLFLLFKSGDDIAERVAWLIRINLTYIDQKIGDKSSREEREEAMGKATLYDLSKARIGFTVTTTARINMLFMSMPVAQNGLDGVTPPTTFSISATDYRGY